MSENSINTIVTQEAFQQLSKLEAGLEAATNKLADFLELSKGNMHIKISYPQDLEKSLKKKQTYLTQLQALEAEAIRLQKTLTTEYAKSTLALTATNAELQKHRLEKNLKNNQVKEEQKLNSDLVRDYDKLQTKLKQLKAEYQDVALAQGKKSQAAKDLGVQVQALAKQLNEANYVEGKSTKKKIQLSLADIETNKIRNSQAREQFRIHTNLNGAYAKQSATLNRLRKDYKDLAVQKKENTSKAKKLLAQIKKLDKQLKSVDASVGQFQRSVGNYGSAWNRLGGFMRTAAAAFGVYSALDVGRKIFMQVKEIDQLNKAMIQVTETTDAFNQATIFLSNLAERTGVDLNDLQFSYTKFLASAKETNLTLAETQDIFTQTATAGAVLGLSTDQVNGAMRALEQILSKGKVQAEEIRGQLGERLPGAFQILAKSMGKTTEELNKMLEDGKVISDEVLPGFAKALEETFSLQNIERVETLAAAQGRVGNAWNEFIRSLENDGGTLTKTFMWLLNTVTSVVDKLRYLNDGVNIRANDNYNNNLERQGRQYELLRKQIEERHAKNATADEKELERLEKKKKLYEDILKTANANPEGEQSLVPNKEWQDIAAKNIEETTALIDARNKKIKEGLTLEQDVDIEIKAFAEKQINRAQNKINQKEDEIIRMRNEIEAWKKSGTEAVVANATQRANYYKLIEQYTIEIGGLRGIVNAASRQVITHPLDPRKKREEPDKPGKDYTKEDAFKLAQSRLKREIEIQEEIQENDEYNAQVRLIANGQAMKKRIELLDLEANYEKTLMAGRADAITKIEEDLNFDKEQLAKENLANVKDIMGDNFAARMEHLEELQAAEEEKLDHELYDLREELLKQGASKEEIEKAVQEKKREYQLRSIQDLINFHIKELELYSITADEKEEIEKKIFELRKRYQELLVGGLDDGTKSEEEILKERHENLMKWVDFAAEAFNAVMDLSNAFTERRIANIDREIAKNNEMYNGILENERLTDEQRTSIENQRDIENAKLEEKKKKEQLKQAKFQKAQAAINVIFQTAGAVMTAIGVPPYGLGPILGSPFAIAASALGAVQLATVLAQPLPQFEKGKDAKDGYAGPMIWGEKRKEVKLGADGSIEVSPNKPTLGTTKKGDTIFPSIKAFGDSVSYEEVVRASMLTSIANQHENLQGYQLENILDSHLRSARDEMRKGVEDAMRSWKIPTQQQPDLEGVLKRIQKRNV